jgi:hypothetical protein
MSMSRVLGVTGGSYLLGESVWIPIWLGLAFTSLCIPVLLWLKDHRDNLLAQKNSPDQGDYSLRAAESCDPAESHKREESNSQKQDIPPAKTDQFVGRPMSLLRSFSTYSTFMLKHSHILAIFLVHESGMGVRNITEQWMSQRYAWPLRTTGYILASETFVGSIFLAVLPVIARYLPRGSSARGGPSEQRQQQIYIIRGSLFAAAGGVAIIAASGSSRVAFLVALGMFALAVGFHDALKSYVTGLVDVSSITRLYMCISIVETCANIINGPTWAWIYTVGMSYGVRGMPLPFLLCCLLFLGALGLVTELA